MNYRTVLAAWIGISLMSPQVLFAAPVLKIKLAIKGNEMAFDKIKLSAKPGQKIELEFKNTVAKDTGLQHNFILTQPGKDADLATAGIIAGPGKGYVPDSPDIIAKTKLLNPGESDKIEFTAPDKAGDYPYICTFPAHYPMMKGTLTVK
jgi:azurin